MLRKENTSSSVYKFVSIFIKWKPVQYGRNFGSCGIPLEYILLYIY
jgi:hypothetical protein